MSENKLLELQRMAEVCSEEATRLKMAYAKLQERFDHVNQELGVRAEQASRATHFLGALLQKISDAILFIDLTGLIAVANDAAHKILNKEGLAFKRFWEIFPDDYFGFSMREALRFGISHRLLYKSYVTEGKELEISTSFLYEGPKHQHGLILLFRDITERQKLQQGAARADRMKELGEMAAQVAHEIRNPLGGIRGFATLLHRDLVHEPHLQEMAAQVIEGTKALEKLVTTVLQYTRPTHIVPQTLDLSFHIKQLAKFIKVDPAFPSNVKLQLHLAEEPLLAPFDPNALKSALLNLLVNGWQAMPQGGTLTISLLKVDASCQIVISDTGVGMNEEQLSALFAPFFTTKQTGNGIGLVETQKIVQAHGGLIDVRSAPGRGSAFTIILPLKR
ncbi:MAG: two-component sensor histidine kinase [Verrucomicrobiota bacterium]|nr:two-component sensor histidine kinase [Verrucomicrobiota bacterium]